MAALPGVTPPQEGQRGTDNPGHTTPTPPGGAADHGLSSRTPGGAGANAVEDTKTCNTSSSVSSAASGGAGGRSGVSGTAWEVYCDGPLLEAVQSARLFPDSKTFVDMPMKQARIACRVPYRTVPYRTVPCAVPYRTVPCAVPYRAVYRTVPYRVPYRTVPCAVPSRAMCRALSCRVPYRPVPCAVLYRAVRPRRYVVVLGLPCEVNGACSSL